MNLKRVAKVVREPRYLSWALKIQMTSLLKSVSFSRRTSVQDGQKRVIMFHIGRSGSTVLADILARHRNIMWSGEIAKGIAGRRTESPAEKCAALDKKVDDALKKYSRYNVYGFEIKPFHVREIGLTIAEFSEWARKHGFTKYIILERKNYLRKILSSITAKQSGRWHSPANVKNSLEKTRLPIDLVRIDQKQSSLIELLDEYSADFAEVRSALEGRSVLELSYELDIQQDPRIAAKRCYEFLGVEAVHLNARYGRTNPYSIAESIQNPQEVRDTLKGSKYAWMIEE